MFVLVVAASCHSPQKKEGALHYDRIVLSDASGFRIEKVDGQTRILTILNPADTAVELAQVVLRSQDYKHPLKAGEVRVPCQRIICLSSTQLSYLFELDNIEPVVGINSSRHLFNAKAKAKIKSSTIKQVGKEGKFNIEMIAGLNPDVIFVSPFKTGGYDAIKHLGFPLVPMAAYKESTPLGRAEWIKMMAPFVGMEFEADSIFSETKCEYETLKKLVVNVENRPTVFSGKMNGSAWYVAGGGSFFAHLFRDAGADYVIKDNKQGAYPLDFESLYNIANDAEYWRLLVSSSTPYNYESLQAEDKRYTFFDAFQDKKIISCNLRMVPYREMSPVKPHVLLADYISHFHPELLPGYTPVFWKKMK